MIYQKLLNLFFGVFRQSDVPQLHAGRDFNYRTSCKKLHFKYLLLFQQSAETRLAGSLLLAPGLVLFCFPIFISSPTNYNQANATGQFYKDKSI